MIHNKNCRSLQCSNAQCDCSETKHTPTPWNYDSEFIRNWEANAEFIIRAVNSHDELLKVVKNLRAHIVAYNQRQKSSTNMIGSLAIHEADEAIAKAEGK